MTRLLSLLCPALSALLFVAGPSARATESPPPLTRAAVDGATLAEPRPAGRARTQRPDPLLVRLQVILDRARFSPGAIDGRDGDNFRRALSAYAAARGLPARTLTLELARALIEADGAPALATYTVTQADADTAFLPRVPPRLEEQSDLGRLEYTNAREMLAERFHMSRALLSALNPDAAFDRPGTTLLVAAVEPMDAGKPAARDLPRAPRVARIEVDKATRAVRTFDGAGKLLAYYPASIGSAEKPAPSEDTTVTQVAFEPTYTYDPRYAFAGVKARRKFSIEAGPNNPVGVVWIDLALPSYGIHGTPEPEKVGKTESHGCIRLTNWSARPRGARGARCEGRLQGRVIRAPLASIGIRVGQPARRVSEARNLHPEGTDGIRDRTRASRRRTAPGCNPC